MSARLLLDFDGVVLRDKRMSMYQTQRSAKFVKLHTALPMKTADFVNKRFYPVHGHTVLMLRERFFKDVTLEEYNDFVFDKRALKRLPVTKEMTERGRAFRPLFYDVDNGFDTWIFTNAHWNWIEHFVDIFDLPIKADRVIWPKDLTRLKPNEKAYKLVETKIGKEVEKVFVDDSEVNLVYPRKLGWKTVLWSEESTPELLLRVVSNKSWDT